MCRGPQFGKHSLLLFPDFQQLILLNHNLIIVVLQPEHTASLFSLTSCLATLNTFPFRSTPSSSSQNFCCHQILYIEDSYLSSMFSPIIVLSLLLSKSLFTSCGWTKSPALSLHLQLSTPARQCTCTHVKLEIKFFCLSQLH